MRWFNQPINHKAPVLLEQEQWSLYEVSTSYTSVSEVDPTPGAVNTS